MRMLKAIAILIFGIAGCAAARAADLPGEADRPRDVFIQHVPYGRIAGQILIYDFQPGVVVRAYWLPPWRHRHYFPFRAKQDAADVAPADDGPPVPAESFERYWSTSETFVRELPRRVRETPLRARDEALPGEEPFKSSPQQREQPPK